MLLDAAELDDAGAGLAAAAEELISSRMEDYLDDSFEFVYAACQDGRSIAADAATVPAVPGYEQARWDAGRLVLAEAGSRGGFLDTVQFEFEPGPRRDDPVLDAMSLAEMEARFFQDAPACLARLYQRAADEEQGSEPPLSSVRHPDLVGWKRRKLAALYETVADGRGQGLPFPFGSPSSAYEGLAHDLTCGAAAGGDASLAVSLISVHT